MIRRVYPARRRQRNRPRKIIRYPTPEDSLIVGRRLRGSDCLTARIRMRAERRKMTTPNSATISSDQATLGTLRIGDLSVGRLGFGAMRITGRGVWGPPADRAAAVRLLRRAVELGVTFIDTADSYGPGVSEELIAEALAPYRDGLVIATKGGLTRPGPGEWRRDGRPAHLRAACEASLKRLRTDRIDLYQLHSPDPRVPLDDCRRAHPASGRGEDPPRRRFQCRRQRAYRSTPSGDHRVGAEPL